MTLAAVLPSIISAVVPFLLQKFGSRKAKKTGSAVNFDYQNNPAAQNIMKMLQGGQELQPFNPDQYNEYFNKGIADPALKYYEERIRPRTQAAYRTNDAIYGGAMKNALDQGAGDLATSLAGMRANYVNQGRQQHENSRYNNIAQQIGLLDRQAVQTHSFVQGPQHQMQDIAGMLGPILQSIDWKNIFKDSSQGEPYDPYSFDQKINGMNNMTPSLTNSYNPYGGRDPRWGVYNFTGDQP